tara:strand:- start:13829 stop:14251 length:423 start_codon:yes stop_codon:yes gene_type:complete
MSTVKVNTLTGTSTAGSIAVTGEGNSTTTNLQQGLAKALFNVTNNSTLVSGGLNVSSLNDRANGRMTISLTNNMSNTTTMSCVGDCSETSSANGATNSNRNCNVIRGDNAGEVFVATTEQNTGSLDDTAISNGIVMGGLA